MIGAFSQLWAIISSFKLFWKVLQNWSEMRVKLEALKGVLVRVKDNGIPSCDDTKELLDFSIWLLKTEMIDIPGVDEYQLTRELERVQMNLICQLKTEGKK